MNNVQDKHMSKKFDATSTAQDVLTDVDLKDKRFLVTGTSAGIGVETAHALVSRGASVVGLVRDLAKDVDLDDPNFSQQPYDPFVAYGRSKTAETLFAVAFDKRHRHRGVRAAAVMPGNSLTELPRNFSAEQLQGLFETVGKARAEAGLPPGQLKDVGQAAATSVWAAVVADADEIGGRYLEDCAVAPVNDAPNPFADGVRSYALDAGRAEQLWARTQALQADRIWKVVKEFPRPGFGASCAGSFYSQRKW